jgi:hypothetical protein
MKNAILTKATLSQPVNTFDNEAAPPKTIDQPQFDFGDKFEPAAVKILGIVNPARANDAGFSNRVKACIQEFRVIRQRREREINEISNEIAETERKLAAAQNRYEIESKQPFTQDEAKQLDEFTAFLELDSSVKMLSWDLKSAVARQYRLKEMLEIIDSQIEELEARIR